MNNQVAVASDHANEIEAIALRSAVRAMTNSDKQLYKAVCAAALNLCVQQIRVTLTNGLYTPSADKYVFNKLMFAYASSGKMIWRNSDEEVAAIVALPAGSKERLALSTIYVRQKNRKLVSGLALIRTNAFRLAQYMRDNQRETIIGCAQANSAEAAVSTWERAVEIFFGGSFARLSAGLGALSHETPKPLDQTAIPKRPNDPTVVISNKAAVDLNIDYIFGLIAKLEPDDLRKITEKVNELSRSKFGIP